MTTLTANDKNGVALALGDEVTFRGPVVDMRDGSLMVRIDTPNMGHRELWFHGSWVERSAQGAGSLAAEKPAPAPVAAVTKAETDEPVSLREQAVAFVMTRGYERAAAEKIVEEHGTRYILADRDEEAALKKASPAPGTVGSAAAASSAAPSTTTENPANQSAPAAPNAGTGTGSASPA